MEEELTYAEAITLLLKGPAKQAWKKYGKLLPELTNEEWDEMSVEVCAFRKEALATKSKCTESWCLNKLCDVRNNP